jgi:hypothetical protein
MFGVVVFCGRRAKFFSYSRVGSLALENDLIEIVVVCLMGHGVNQTTNNSSVGDRIHRPDRIAGLC